MPKKPSAVTPATDADDLPNVAQITISRDELHVILTSVGSIIAFTCITDDKTAILATTTFEHANNVVESVGFEVIENLLHKLHTAHVAVCPSVNDEIERTLQRLQ